MTDMEKTMISSTPPHSPLYKKIMTSIELPWERQLIGYGSGALTGDSDVREDAESHIAPIPQVDEGAQGTRSALCDAPAGTESADGRMSGMRDRVFRPSPQAERWGTTRRTGPTREMMLR